MSIFANLLITLYKIKLFSILYCEKPAILLILIGNKPHHFNEIQPKTTTLITP